MAVLATWFVPGAGHLLLGRAGLALAAFLVVEGLFALGWLLGDGRAFEFLDPELRGAFATLLSPEVGNLGGMIAQLKLRGFGDGLPTPFPDGIHLASMLAGASGLVNACVMVHVHLAARAPQPAAKQASPRHPALLVLCGWLVPGLGHALQGRIRRAGIVFALLIGLFVLGTALCDGANLSRERHFYYWAGQFLLGLPAILTELASGHPPLTSQPAFADVGLLFGCMAGLLNVLALLDVAGVGEKRWLGEPDGVGGVDDAGQDRPVRPGGTDGVSAPAGSKPAGNEPEASSEPEVVT